MAGDEHLGTNNAIQANGIVSGHPVQRWSVAAAQRRSASVGARRMGGRKQGRSAIDRRTRGMGLIVAPDKTSPGVYETDCSAQIISVSTWSATVQRLQRSTNHPTTRSSETAPGRALFSVSRPRAFP